MACSTISQEPVPGAPAGIAVRVDRLQRPAGRARADGAVAEEDLKARRLQRIEDAVGEAGRIVHLSADQKRQPADAEVGIGIAEHHGLMPASLPPTNRLRVMEIAS